MSNNHVTIGRFTAAVYATEFAIAIAENKLENAEIWCLHAMQIFRFPIYKPIYIYKM